MIVTRDSPWDDDEREDQYALDELVCPDCGQLRAICSSDDPDLTLYPQRTVCKFTAVRELVMRQLHEKHKKNEPGTKDLHPFDGLRVWVSEFNLNPDDKFFD